MNENKKVITIIEATTSAFVNPEVRKRKVAKNPNNNYLFNFPETNVDCFYSLFQTTPNYPKRYSGYPRKHTIYPLTDSYTCVIELIVSLV